LRKRIRELKEKKMKRMKRVKIKREAKKEIQFMMKKMK